ncbi:hypothetical protein EV363DRAFT_1295573 [Boletus edulis]|nr:hypothetical protein EV363DRAFT_1295573 [Boletus edulis]
MSHNMVIVMQDKTINIVLVSKVFLVYIWRKIVEEPSSDGLPGQMLSWVIYQIGFTPAMEAAEGAIASLVKNVPMSSTLQQLHITCSEAVGMMVMRDAIFEHWHAILGG